MKNPELMKLLLEVGKLPVESHEEALKLLSIPEPAEAIVEAPHQGGLGIHFLQKVVAIEGLHQTVIKLDTVDRSNKHLI
jgi:hypothetical protein